MPCPDWLSDSTLDCGWLYFSHVKNAIREDDWTYHSLHMSKIANIEFYLQGLSYVILAMYIMKDLS